MNPIELTAVSHVYGEGEMRRQVLFELSLTVRRGEIVFLVGPSGCGKTTVLTLIGALRSVQTGSIKVLGRELRALPEAEMVRTRRQIGFIFQSHNLHRSLTALQNVRIGYDVNGGTDRRRADEKCHAMLATVGLGDHLHKRPIGMSGGQKQRVAIARALVGDPPLVLADEPTAALDRATGRNTICLLRDLARSRGTSVLMVTHDSRLFDIADRVLEMEDGRIVDSSAAVQRKSRAPAGLPTVLPSTTTSQQRL